MRAVDIIEKKKQGEILSKEEIRFFIDGYVKGDIPDYQVSAFLMACCFQHLTPQETADLTDVMRISGDTMDLEGIQGYTVDKHSTGGVGDKTTLVLGPLVAACGVVMAKMSGRGLGHTGGTLDKLEAIKGFRSDLSKGEFASVVNCVGVAVCGQTGNIVPADKKLYALRDVTATVEDTALIAASVMSKKLAVANKGLILDVKTGRGAFMKTLDDSIGLAQRMVEIGTLMNRDVIAMVTEMNLPLGFAIGNSLEVQEAIETLDGRGPDDLVELCVELGGRLLFIAGKAVSLSEGKVRIREAIDSKAGLTKFRDMVSAQGGCLESLDNLAIAGNILELKADKQGWICDMDALSVGHAAMKLGAGRERKEDEIDLSVGIKLLKKVGDFVESGETYMSIFYNDDKRLSEVEAQLKAAVKWSDAVVPKPKLILAEITKDGVTIF